MTASADEMTNHSRSSGSASDPSSSPSDTSAIPPAAAKAAKSGSSSSLPLVKANPALSPTVRIVEPPRAGRQNANGPAETPPEAEGTNRQTLAPGDPRRQSDEGEPYLDDANPYGRPLTNQQNRPMGGIGTVVDPNDEERPHDRTEAPTS